LQAGENSSPTKFIPTSLRKKLEIPGTFTQSPVLHKNATGFNSLLIKM
jgi:hypothetical protein